MTYNPKEFVGRLKVLCYEQGIPVRSVESACGTTQGYYSTQLRCVTDYDIRVVSKFFKMSEADFMSIEPYEILKAPRMALAEKDFSKEEWAVIKRAILGVKNAKRENTKKV